MTPELLLEKLKEIKKDVEEKMGPVTDIWLPWKLMYQLDNRDILERLFNPYFIDDTIVTHFMSEKDDRTIRVAFLMECKDEPTDNNGSTSSSS